MRAVFLCPTRSVPFRSIQQFCRRCRKIQDSLRRPRYNRHDFQAHKDAIVKRCNRRQEIRDQIHAREPAEQQKAEPNALVPVERREFLLRYK